MTKNDRQQLTPPLLGFVGYSGSGKTSLLAKVIAALHARGLRLAVIKHAHHSFDIDHAGKDSHVLRHAGADQTLVASKNRWALMVETPDAQRDPQLYELVARLDQSALDLILVEGFKHASFPKIEVHRPCVNPQLLCSHDPDIIAVLTDDTSQIGSAIPVVVLDLNDTANIVQWILAWIEKHHV